MNLQFPSLLLVVNLAGPLAPVVLQAAAPLTVPYVVEGRWSWTEYGSSRTNTYANMPFRAELTESSYYFCGDETALRDVFVQAAGDGVDCYSLEFPLNWKGRTAEKNATNKLPYAFGAVRQGTFPPPEYTFLQTLWLAFCSPGGGGLVRQPALPFGTLASSDPRVSMDSFWAEYQFTANSNLVSEMRVYGPGSGTDKDGKRYALEKPFDNGHLALRYRVRRFGETNGVVIPCEFSLERFWVRSAKMLFIEPRSRDDTALQYSWDFTVTNVTFAPLLSWRPPEFHPTLVALVNELRLGGGEDQARGYVRTKTNMWPSSASVEFRERRTEQAKSIARKRLARTMFWVILCSALLPIIYVVGKNAMRRNAPVT